MAPTALPLGLLHNTKADPAGAPPAAAVREAAPFVANFYIKVCVFVCAGAWSAQGWLTVSLALMQGRGGGGGGEERRKKVQVSRMPCHA